MGLLCKEKYTLMSAKKKCKDFPDKIFESPEDRERRIRDILFRFSEMEEMSVNPVQTLPPGVMPSIYSHLKQYPIPGWEEVFGQSDDIILDISKNVESMGKFLPPPEMVFNSFRMVGPIENVRVVLIGQDPYAQDGVAYGLSFSTAPGVTRIPPSLKVIFKEIKRSYPYVPEPSTGYLGPWAQQGILLLNTSLTLSPGASNSHKNIWMAFINVVLTTIVNKCKGVVFVLWGKEAEGLLSIIGSRVVSLTAGHPSPQNVKSTFHGCGHFLQINKLMTKAKHDAIMHDFSKDRWPEIYKLFNSGQGIFQNIKRWMADQRYREMYGCLTTVQTPEILYMRTLPGYSDLMALIYATAVTEIEWYIG